MDRGRPARAHELQRSDGAAAFDGAEGVWYDAGHVYFTTKVSNRVWDLDVDAQRITVLYDAADFGDDAPLTGVDNVVVSRAGDLYVAEDGGNVEIVVISAEREVAQLLRLVGHDSSELTGPAFDPAGGRLYFSSQRGADGRGSGVTYEVSGPFRGALAAAAPTDAAPQAAPPPPGGGARPRLRRRLRPDPAPRPHPAMPPRPPAGAAPGAWRAAPGCSPPQRPPGSCEADRRRWRPPRRARPTTEPSRPRPGAYALRREPPAAAGTTARRGRAAPCDPRSQSALRQAAGGSRRRA